MLNLNVRAAMALLAFLPFSAAHASDWTTRDVSLAPYPGAFAEFCVPVGEGEQLEVELDTPQPIDFNIHFHTNGKTLFPVKERVSGRVSWSVPARPAGEYCLMWENAEQQQNGFTVPTRFRVTAAE